MRIALILSATVLALLMPVAHARSLEPIPGSITYGGQPRQKLTKSPVGSRLPHEFFNQFGERVHETYIIQPDRSLKLVDRWVEDPFSDD